MIGVTEPIGASYDGGGVAEDGRQAGQSVGAGLPSHRPTGPLSPLSAYSSSTSTSLPRRALPPIALGGAGGAGPGVVPGGVPAEDGGRGSTVGGVVDEASEAGQPLSTIASSEISFFSERSVVSDGGGVSSSVGGGEFDVDARGRGHGSTGGGDSDREGTTSLGLKHRLEKKEPTRPHLSLEDEEDGTDWGHHHVVGPRRADRGGEDDLILVHPLGTHSGSHEEDLEAAV